MLQNRQRAQDLMGGRQDEARTGMRQTVNACGEVTCSEPHCRKHLALVRDVSPGGIFLYSNLDPPVGAELSVSFTMPGAEGYVEVYCHGRVIRREEYPAGAAMGIAALLDRQEISPLT